MRRIEGKRKAMMLYMPDELHQRLEAYMLNHFGRTYGKNEVINEALGKFIGDERTPENPINQTDLASK